MKTIKKKGYYYLRHSYKINEKVKVKDKYLGKDIPDNLEEIGEILQNEALGESLFKKFDQIKSNYQKNWKKLPLSVKRNVNEELTVRFTYNTNAIEGSTLTLDETKELIEKRIAPNKSLDDTQESIRHANVFSEIMGGKCKDISIDRIKKWHFRIFEESKKDIAGEFRDYLVKVGEYLCPDWQDIPKLMRDFFRWYNKNKRRMHTVELAARAHYKFVRIHPFGDGNGRIARLITNFILHSKGFPILVIEYKKRASYYKALRKADKKKSEWEFMKYVFRRYLSNYKEYYRNI